METGVEARFRNIAVIPQKFMAAYFYRISAPMITQSRLKEILDYNPSTGIFTWKARTSIRVRIGDVAGCIRKDGYVVITINGQLNFAHRLAFIWMTGSCPDLVDHINGEKSDNAWTNLRKASFSANSRNRRSVKGSSSKYVGVCWHTRDEKWRAQIKSNGRVIYIGSFENEEEAAKAYDKEAKKHHGEFANTNFP